MAGVTESASELVCVCVCRYVEETALGKAREVASRLESREDWVLVVGADTVVVGPSLLPPLSTL